MQCNESTHSETVLRVIVYSVRIGPPQQKKLHLRAFQESVSMAGLELLNRHRVGGSVILVVQQPSAHQPIACRPSDVG
jgi:hypothetical protein